MCKTNRVFDENVELADNAMLKHRPELFYEWNFEKNGELDIYKVTKGMGKKVWWKCRFEHPSWQSTINSRTNKTNCPYCANKKILKGFNDMWTTNPELAKLLEDSEDGYRYMQSASKRVNWKCPDCNNIIKNRSINNVQKRGFLCPKCSDGISFGEKFIYNLLKEANIEFEYDAPQKWSGRLRYDFYLPDYNWIIEVHGRQHFEASFESIGEGARSLKEEKENDRLKENMAYDNGISSYVVIDSGTPTLEYLKNNILKSNLSKLLPEINFTKIGRMANTTLIKSVCDLWNSGVQDTLLISKQVKVSRTTIISYLKRGAEIGWCDYCPNKSSEINRFLNGKKGTIPVVQFSNITKAFIKEWLSASMAAQSLDISQSDISATCRRKFKTAGGFKWMYKSDYDKMLQEGLTHEEYMSKYYSKKQRN